MSTHFTTRLTFGAAVLLGLAGDLVGQQRLAFVNVNVVPMNREHVLTGQTVLVDGSVITAVGPVARVPVPDGARVIDGTGAYLAPGLADMHVHFLRDETELLLYVAHGVTTVRELSGEPLYLRWREEITAGSRVGPNLYVASPLIDGARGRRATAFRWGGIFGITVALLGLLHLFVVRRMAWRPATLAAAAPLALGAGYLAMVVVVPFPDAFAGRGRVARSTIGSTLEASQAVRRAALRYDQIKLYDALSRGQFRAAVSAARAAGIRTVGHVPTAVGLDAALASGLDELAHVYFLVVDLLATVDTSTTAPGFARTEALRARMHQIVDSVRGSGIDVTSTLTALPELLEQWSDSAAFFARDDIPYRSPAMRRAAAQRARDGVAGWSRSQLETHATWGAIAACLLVRAGTPVALGTDASPVTVLAGASVHDELRHLIGCGLAPFEALRLATVNASRVAGRQGEWGTVATGQRADLVLVAVNPLDEPATLRRPLGVLVAGRWYPRADLDELLTTVAERRSPR